MWLLPTRNRPEACQELLEAMIETEVPRVAVMIDGPQYDMVWPSHWRIHQSDVHLEMGGALNLLYKLYPNEPWYGLITDHSRPLTRNWSQKIESAIKPRSIVLVNDTKNRLNPAGKRRITSASVYGGGLVRSLGWVWLDKVTHMYGDDAWEDIGHALGVIKYLPDVIVKDLLVREGEIPRDENHNRLFMGKPYIERDKKAYTLWRQDFHKLIARLRSKDSFETD
jgi:hypothetical protein